MRGELNMALPVDIVAALKGKRNINYILTRADVHFKLTKKATACIGVTNKVYSINTP